jgi:histone H3/H4
MPKTQAEILDDNHAIWALGTELLPLHGESESKLSHTRRAERIRARSELLRSVLKAESVRRLVRKSGILSYATSSPVGENVDVVLKTLQQIADVILFNVSFEICRLCEYLKKRTVTEDVLREALKKFDVKLHGACVETHKSCPTLKHRNLRAAAHVVKGAESEIWHESQNDSCTYFAFSAFVKLMRSYLREQMEPPPKMTRGVISCVQFVMETALVEVLSKARYLMRQATKGKRDTSSPGRTTVNSRDIKLVLTLLAHRHPILSGRMRALDEPPQPTPRKSPDGERGAHAKAKSAPKVKAASKPKAKSAARARAGT